MLLPPSGYRKCLRPWLRAPQGLSAPFSDTKLHPGCRDNPESTAEEPSDASESDSFDSDASDEGEQGEGEEDNEGFEKIRSKTEKKKDKILSMDPTQVCSQLFRDLWGRIGCMTMQAAYVAGCLAWLAGCVAGRTTWLAVCVEGRMRQQSRLHNRLHARARHINMLEEKYDRMLCAR